VIYIMADTCRIHVSTSNLHDTYKTEKHWWNEMLVNQNGLKASSKCTNSSK